MTSSSTITKTTKKVSIILVFFFTTILIITTAVNAFSSASTIAVTYGTATLCAIVAGKPTQYIQCYQNGKLIPVEPKVSFQAISGGRSFFCGLRSGGFSLQCWDTNALNTVFQPKRLFHNDVVQLTDISVGDTHVCARELHSGVARCWRGSSTDEFPSPGAAIRFRRITSGFGFSCGILEENRTVWCWGDRGNGYGVEIQRKFGNLTMSSLVAGESHVCGLTLSGVLVCKGNNGSGQLNVPLSSPSEFSSGLVLGADFTCAIRKRNGLVVCWGGSNRFGFDTHVIQNVSFESIVAGLDFVCGLTTKKLSLICWGHGWSNNLNLPIDVPLGMVLPGPCVKDSCSSCGTFPNSDELCHGSGSICYSCMVEVPLAVPLFQSPSQVPKKQFPSAKEKVRRFLRRKVDNSVKPTSAESDTYADIVPMSNLDHDFSSLRSFSSKRLGSRKMRRNRSGSSSKHVDKTESFSLFALATATNNFSVSNKIGAGSFGSVYRGKLEDGRDMAVKRGDFCTKKRKFQDKEMAFDSELALLSRLHHKHLVKLIGFCEEKYERLLVYEYMSNGSIHDHLHDKSNIHKSSSILNSWKMRIKIALGAARGIEYMHNYAVPPIIHRDIKSSNILLDSNWNARVSDFGLSLIWPENEQEFVSTITNAVGTVGYIDPEYYILNVLTTKSDVYGLGVVLLELLTGKRAVFKTEDGSSPIGVVEYAVPNIGSGELWNVLDDRVGEPEVNEIESLEIMAYTAMHCVNLVGRERPEMSDIVANLERALAFVEGSPSSFSITSYSAPLE
ncbi:PREDICTED: putative serine/threonine-protein kinase-like protein CCR3 isoform X2 [Lupinus angustifolius]|uniref:putative serine/threonine-protein kinase-like protein CCR3 isoform X2 n=1 Tax=Lupinus angustifolius TaxID=3871 RepID=UPI00092F01CE|nr:PREDICTED: putative serine/threonine-protein kinase-like protein CCR3 isoform X2 [Lupinus angustifolius]